jgi:hypothetical protein
MRRRASLMSENAVPLTSSALSVFMKLSHKLRPCDGLTRSLPQELVGLHGNPFFGCIDWTSQLPADVILFSENASLACETNGESVNV